MSYANMDNVPTQTAGTSELLASDWNTYVRDNFDSIKFGHLVCTSSTRPTGIGEGTMIYETDTNKVLVYSGSVWVEVSDITNGSGSVVQRNVVSAVVTAASTYSITASEADIPNLSVSITPTSSSSKILVFGCVSGSATSSSTGALGNWGIRLKRGSTSLALGDANSSNTRHTVFGNIDTSWPRMVGFVHLDSPSTTSSTTYKCTLVAAQSSGTATYYINSAATSETTSPWPRVSSSITVMEVPVV